MVEATNVSPAPSESTTLSGGLADAEMYVSLSKAIAPSLPHGQINFAL